ncbi:MAG TPA: ADOP family duplicated permease [Gemmatimonadaceae bacterium]|nr:ADOP family duplicated permease [Gemmatimonadaceae bacterium]
MSDIRVAIRTLGRSPGFVTAAVLSLGLALGAGIAGFGVLDAVRFRALPFPNADRLVLISEVPKGGCPNVCDVNYKTFALLREHAFKTIDALAGFAGGGKSLGTGIDQLNVTAAVVSESVFGMLGVRPELGRTFAADEDRLGAAPTMLIGHDLWATYFKGDTSVLGKTYMLSDEPYTVVGVMPPGFSFESRSEVWLAASRYLDPRTGTSLRAVNVLARLAPGATMQQLAGELRTVEAAANEGRADKAKVTFGVSPLRERYVLATRGNDVVFAAIVAAILAIGCANVASLILVRAMRHRRALAVRRALGASSGMVVRYLFLENLVLCVAGLALGLVLAGGSLHALQSVAPLQGGARAAGMEYVLDLRASAFALALTIFVTCALTVAPVRLLVGSDLQSALREGASAATVSRAGHRIQQVFVVVQTACAVALLVATGLMARTTARLSRVALGYDASHVASVTAVPVHSWRLEAKYLPAADRALTDIASIPGVEAAALRMPVPFAVGKPRAPGVIVVRPDLDDATMTLDAGREIEPALRPKSAFGVSPDYFRVMGIPLVAGRSFTQTDDASGPAVAIINRWAARHWWPSENPIGRTFTVDTAPGTRAVVTVIGVVRDNLAGQPSILLAKPGPEVYRPFKQSHFWLANYYARAAGGAGRVVEEMQNAVMRSMASDGRPRGTVLSEQVNDQLRTVRTSAAQIAGFAIVGWLLAVTGLYGVLSYVVQQRTQEIGIRGVLGAGRGRIVGMIMSQAMRLALAGIGVGLAAAAAMGRLMASLLYGTPTNDLAIYASVSLLALLVSLAASWVPARRAARVDPAIALRAL